MDQNHSEIISQWLEFPLGFAESIQLKGLDFSMDSLELVDRCLGMFQDGMKEWPQEQFQENLNFVVLGWGAYIGEAVRRTDPAWTWEFPEDELPQLVREGPGGLGRLTWPPMALALARLREEELNVAQAVRQQLEAVAKLFEQIQEHPELLKGEEGC